MVKENIALKSVKFVFHEILIDIVYWPIWWYTKGAQKAFKRMLQTIVQGNQELGVTVWVKNLFKPMFGQYDWQGRLISFFMRLIQIIIRFIILLFWIIFSVIVFFIWLILPLFIVAQILLNLGLFSKLV